MLAGDLRVCFAINLICCRLLCDWAGLAPAPAPGEDERERERERGGGGEYEKVSAYACADAIGGEWPWRLGRCTLPAGGGVPNIAVPPAPSAYGRACTLTRPGAARAQASTSGAQRQQLGVQLPH